MIDQALSHPHLVMVMGYARSGSTLIGSILGELPGVAHVGELDRYWQRTLDAGSGRPCSCGLAHLDCPHWIGVRQRLPDHNVEALAGAELHWFGTIGWKNARPPATRASTAQLAEALTQLHGALGVQSDAATIIDSSKKPRYANLLAEHYPGRISFVHLVRDVRGVVWSRQRKGLQKSMSHPGLQALKDTRAWCRNLRESTTMLAAQPAGRARITVRYEDFVAEPRRVVAAISAAVGLGDVAQLLTDRDAVVLHENHAHWGNRNRFQRGRIQIRLDDAWRTALPTAQRVAITTLAYRSLRRQNYI